MQKRKAAQCASSIPPEVVFEASMTMLGFLKKEEAPLGLDEPSRVEEYAGGDCTVD